MSNDLIQKYGAKNFPPYEEEKKYLCIYFCKNTKGSLYANVVCPFTCPLYSSLFFIHHYVRLTKGSRKCFFLVALLPPLELSGHIFFGSFASSKKSYFSLVARPLPPTPLLLAGPLKTLLFCGFPKQLQGWGCGM